MGARILWSITWFGLSSPPCSVDFADSGAFLAFVANRAALADLADPAVSANSFWVGFCLPRQPNHAV